jgi:hypothetical protein
MSREWVRFNAESNGYQAPVNSFKGFSLPGVPEIHGGECKVNVVC